MTSKNSFWARCRENNKRRIWVWVISILLQFAAYPVVMLIYLSRIHFYQEQGTYLSLKAYQEALWQAAADAAGFQPKAELLIIILAVLIGAQGFFYLHDRKKVDMYHSVPISMKNRYLTIYLNGIAIYLLPYMGSLVIALLLAALQKALCVAVLAECVYAFFMNVLFFLFLYHMTILAVMLTGNRIIMGFLLTGMLAFEMIAVQFFNDLKYAFFERADRTFIYAEAKLSPILDYDGNISRLKYTTKIWDIDHAKIQEILLPLYGKWLVLALVLGILGYFCYQKRPAEAAGKAIVFLKMQEIIKVIVSIMAGIAAGIFIFDAVYYNSWLIVAAMLSVTVLCCGVMEVVYEADIRAVLNHLVSSGIAVAGILLIFVIYQFDIFGYDTYVPKADKVESIALDVGEFYQDYFTEYRNSREDYREYLGQNSYFKDNMFLHQTEAICTLAQKSIGKTPEDMEEGRAFSVMYRLKSGRKVGRKIYVDYAEKENAALLDEILGSKEYIDCVYQIDAQKLSENPYLQISYHAGGAASSIVNREDGEELAARWRKDMEQFDFSFARENRTCGQIKFFFEDSYDSLYLPVYDSFSNTIAFLKEKGAYVPLMLNAEDITNITITNYHYDDMQEDNAIQPRTMEAVAEREYPVYNEESSTVSGNPEEIAEIIEHIYPDNLGNFYQSPTELDNNYEVAVSFAPEIYNPYDGGIYYYRFVKGEVPAFVIEDTASQGIEE